MTGAEREFVRWMQRATRRDSPWQGLGIGDDMAALPNAGCILVSSDILLDGTHFDCSQQSYEAIGRKAAGCGLSDCAAMAVKPLAALVSVAWPKSAPGADLRRVMEGVIGICGEFDCTVVGGDTTSWPHPLAIDVVLLAEPYEGIAPVRRDGARAGDGVYVTGRLGGSLLGKHLAFTPRVREARVIAERMGARLHALIDITDGLAIDLDRVVEASGVGGLLDETSVLAAASDAAHEASRSDGRSVLAHVLGDGEDFELLLAGELAEPEATDLGLVRVGEIVMGKGLTLREADGTVRPLAPAGYEHL